jgi:hypothetical protein
MNDESVTVTISDTGLGIPPEEQRLIFDEFRQSDRTTARGSNRADVGDSRRVPSTASSTMSRSPRTLPTSRP